MRDYIKSIIEEINNASKEKNTDYFCLTRDIFQARLDSYISHTGQYLLSAVKKCESDLEAIKVAFTEQISGRAPEQRGNGLKFVLESVKEKKWSLYFQSGVACCIIENGNVEFLEGNDKFPGCVAVLKAGAD